MRLLASTQVNRTSTWACQAGPAARAYASGGVLSQSFRAALFSERDFNVFVREDGTNFDVSAQGADIIAQCSKFDFGAFFEAGNFALLHLHGKRELSLSHFTVLTQLIERHAFENGIGALFSAGATGFGHQLIRDVVVGEGSVCHSVLSRLPDAEAGLRLLLQCAQVFEVKFIGFANQFPVKAASPMFVATDQQDSGTCGIEGEECAKRQMLVVRSAQFLHVGKRRSLHGIDVRPGEYRASFLEKVYRCIERFPFFPREGLHPFPKLRRGANLVSHEDIMRCDSYNVKLIFSVAAGRKS